VEGILSFQRYFSKARSKERRGDDPPTLTGFSATGHGRRSARSVARRRRRSYRGPGTVILAAGATSSVAGWKEGPLGWLECEVAVQHRAGRPVSRSLAGGKRVAAAAVAAWEMAAGSAKKSPVWKHGGRFEIKIAAAAGKMARYSASLSRLP
jgi:hypothetical protein